MKKKNYNNLISKYHLNESDIDWEKMKSNLRQFYYYDYKDTPDDIKTKYERYISNEIKLFHHNNLEKNYDNTKELYDTSYDIGIFMIGFSDSPILMSLDVIRPEKIIFIYTEDSKTTIENMEEHIKQCNASNMDYLKDVFINEIKEKGLTDVKDFIASGEKAIKINLGKTARPVDTFKAIKDIISDKSLKRIAVDITGGKKTMISGAFSSASLREDVDIIYVDNEEYNREQRRPEPGTEFISKVQNPNDIYRYTDMERIKGLFDSHRYDIASKDIEAQLEVMDRYGDEYYGNEKIKLRELKKWADIYNDWDQYRYSVFSVDSNSEDIKKLHGLNEQDELLLKNVANKLDLSERKNPSYILQKVFEDIEDIIEKNNIEYYDKVFSFVAVDRYCNAERRKKTDNEGCIIRLCSIIELLTYYYLIKNHRCLSINGNQQVSSNEIIKAVYGNYSSESGGSKQLGLNLYKRIRLVTGTISNNDKINVKWNVEKCKNRMTFNDESAGRIIEEIKDKRNESSITHSIGFVEDERIDEYLQKTKVFIKWVFRMKEEEFKDLEKKITFRKAESLGF